MPDILNHTKKRPCWRWTGWVFLLMFFCISSSSVSAQQKNVILATTTSIQDCGLLDLLIPVFQKRTGYFVKTIAVGSGQAIAMGRKGEADVLLVHSPEEENQFMREGFGVNRRRVMHNDFMIVGPLDDPAKIQGMRAAAEAFRKMASSSRLFLSRGDHSGTHVKEKTIWSLSRINPEGEKWYQQTGLGMGQTLSIASEKRGYTLTDRGTYLALKKNLGLKVLVEGDPFLLNLYHVIEISPIKWSKVNSAGARAFVDFMVSKDAQEIIRTFGVDRFGAPLFFSDAGKKEGERGR